jgi:hypothetical protein
VIALRAAVGATAPDPDEPPTGGNPASRRPITAADSRDLATPLATLAADSKGIRGVSSWRRRESNPCEGSEQKRVATRTYPPNQRNRLDMSLPFDPAPSRMMPPNGTESGHKEGTKS